MELMIKISQVLKLLLIVALIIITPLLSTSLRTTYLYFIVHLLIISLGVEAGLISFFSKSSNHKIKPSSINIITQKQHNNKTTIPEVVAFSPLGTSTNKQETAVKEADHFGYFFNSKAANDKKPSVTSEQETAPKAKYDRVNQESSRSHEKMDLGPNSTSKTNSKAEHCPRPNKETNCHLTDRCGSGTTNIIAKNNTCKVLEKSVSEKNFGVGKVQQEAVKKCLSIPSLFFIGSSSGEENEVEEILQQQQQKKHTQYYSWGLERVMCTQTLPLSCEDREAVSNRSSAQEEILKEEKYTDEKEEFGEITKQELFHKAETFIGDFYKQLKIQREDSWKRLHDFYHNAAK